MNEIDYKKLVGKQVNIKHGLAMLGLKGEVLKFIEDGETQANAYRLGYAILDDHKAVLNFTPDEATKTVIEKTTRIYSERRKWVPWEKELIKTDLMCGISLEESVSNLAARGTIIDKKKVCAMRSFMLKELKARGITIKKEAEE